ncbi:LamG-like jellyroll fold domain-containing protein [Gracilibacillus marinus]|uniref:LamG-like jellyroll fold domain-containing protein n=1 Tax=Gracilibacillus marinus TaxID=630535 RepID=A0ABV8VX05_9BACI
MKRYLSIFLILLLLLPTTPLSVFANTTDESQQIEATSEATETPVTEKVNQEQNQAISNETIVNNSIPSLPEKPEVPALTNVSVHDPSIIAADGKFYAFGTHIDAAKSDDLIHWETFTNGYTTPGNALYGDLSANLSEAFEWAGEDDSDSKDGYAVWAPEIFFNPDYKWEDGTTGAYLIYYSASSTYIRSVIGFAAAKEIEGPYEHVDTLIYSGFTNKEAYDQDSTVNKHWENTNIKQLIDDGVLEDIRSGWFNNSEDYNNSTFTNAIDANLFYDENGKLWMTYGSWSGGIFILEVDKETGRVIYPGQDGKTEDGRLIDRYFGTKISGGYTKSGEGPYVEYNPEDGYYYLYVTYGWLGADGAYHMRQFRSESPDGPYLDRAGNPAVLPGNESNASYGNKLAGNFLFKREPGDPGTGEGYGYVSPGHNSIYTDKETNQQFNVFHTRFPNRGEVHELRVHQMFTNQDGWRIMAPLRYAGETLDASITDDAIIGSYKYINHGKNNSVDIVESELINLNQDGTISGAVNGTWEHDGYYATLTVNNETYDGVFVEMWDEVSQMWLMTFTALSDQGISIWGVQHPMKASSDEEIIQMVADEVNLPTSTYANLTLPTKGTKGTSINWTSSNPDVISATGIVTRPEVGASAEVVTLTATFTLNETTITKSFDVTVTPYQKPELRAHYRFDGNLSDDTGQFEDATLVGDKPNKIGEGNLLFEEGRFGEALYLDGASGALLPKDILKENHFSIGFWFNPEELQQFTPSLFVMQDENNWFTVNPKGWNNEILLWSRIMNPNEKYFDGITGIEATVGEWQHVVMTNEYGRLRLYLNGERVATASNFNEVINGADLTVALGVNPFDSAFKGYFDELVIYQAHTLSSEDVSDLYEGTIPEIKEQEQEKVSAHFTFDKDLSDATSNHPSATVTGDRIDNTGRNVEFNQSGIDHSIYLDGESGVHLGKGLITGHEYSVSFWLKPEELLDFTTTFFGAQSGTSWTSFLPGGSHGGGVTKLWSGESWYDANLDFMIDLNKWSHITYTVDNGALHIYVNGELAFSGENFPNVFINDEAVFSLGVNFWDVPYKGYVDDLIIYDTHVLSAEDVKDYYTKTLPLIDQPTNPDDTPEEEVIIEDIETDFTVKSGPNGEKIYVVKTPANVFELKTDIFAQLEETDQVEVTDNNVRVRIPAALFSQVDSSIIRFKMDNVTETLATSVNADKEKLLSQLIRFSLTDENGNSIDFSDNYMDLYFTIDLEQVEDIGNLKVVYFNNEGTEVTDHNAEILEVTESGVVIVRVNHFSTYGIVEVLNDSESGTGTDTPNVPDSDENNDTDEEAGSGDGTNTDSIQTDDDATNEETDSDKENESTTDVNSTDSDDEENQTLPETATNTYNLILVGILFIFAAGAMMLFQRKRRN